MRQTCLPVILAALAAPALPAAQLTATNITHYMEVVSHLLGISFRPQQRAELQAMVENYDRQGDQARIKVVLDSESMWQKLQSTEPALREVALTMSRPDVLLNLEKDKAQPDSRWLLDQYYRVNPPLAPGKSGSIPLTKSMVDAALEMEAFVQGEIKRMAPATVDPAVRERAYQEAARTYASLTAEQQMDLARKAGQLALERGQWRIMNPQFQAVVRANMGVRLTAEEQMMVSEFQNMGRNHMNAMLGSQIQNMKQNSEMIMGSGTTWNPTLGRWEQRGGIITEYDSNTVRVP